jgi:hypothetical protein
MAMGTYGPPSHALTRDYGNRIFNIKINKHIKLSYNIF